MNNKGLGLPPEIEAAARANNVAMILQGAGITTDDLVEQLKLRGRLHKITASEMYYTELAEDSRYMEHCSQQAMQTLIRAMDNKLLLTWKDSPTPMSHQAVRQVSIVLLLTEEQRREIADPDSAKD